MRFRLDHNKRWEEHIQYYILFARLAESIVCGASIFSRMMSTYAVDGVHLCRANILTISGPTHVGNFGFRIDVALQLGNVIPLDSEWVLWSDLDAWVNWK